MKRILAGTGVFLLLPVAAALASPVRTAAVRPETATDAAPVLQLAWGKAPSRSAMSEGPPRGSSAQIHGGSSADRYGGSSADRGGVDGAYDRRTRGAHSRGDTNWSRMSTTRNRSREERLRAEEGQDEEGGRSRQGTMSSRDFLGLGGAGGR